MSTKKLTKRELFSQIAELDAIKKNADYAELIANEILKLTPKPDELSERIVETLKILDGFSSIRNILAELNDPEISSSKIVPRLSKLIKDGVVEKVEAKLEGGSKVMTYKLVD